MSNNWQQKDNRYRNINVDGYILENEIDRDEYSLIYRAYNSQLPRPKGRGLRLRKKSCRFWLVDRTAYYDQIY